MGHLSNIERRRQGGGHCKTGINLRKLAGVPDVLSGIVGKNNKANNIAQLKIDDTIISDDGMMAESFNDYFVNIAAKLANEIENNTVDPVLSDNVITRPDLSSLKLTQKKYFSN